MNLVKGDFYRIVRSASFWIIFGLMCVCGVTFIWFSYAIENGKMGVETIATASGLMDTMLITIMGPVLAAIFICSDFQNKTIYNEVLYGKGRTHIIWMKMISYVGMTFIILLPYAISTFVGYFSKYSFSSLFSNSVDSAYATILVDTSAVEVDSKGIAKLFILLILVALAYASRLSICVLLSYWFKKPIAVIAVGIFAELLLGLIPALLSGSEVMRKCVSWTPFVTMRDTYTWDANWTDLLKAGMVSIGFIAMVLGITSGIFNKSEIK